MGLSQHRMAFFIFTAIVICFLMPACAGDDPAQKKRAKALQDLGSSLAAEGQLRRALSKLIEADKLDPNNPDINHQIAIVLRNLGNYSLSLKYFKRALALKSPFPEAQNNLGTLYLVQRQWDKAIACFEEAVADLEYRTPQYAYNNMGIAYFNKREYDKAIESYKQALKAAPRYRLCYINLVQAYEQKGDLQAAADAYRKYLEYFPKDAAFRLALGKLLLRMGDRAAAEKELQLTVEYGGEGREAGEAKALLGKQKE
ncbi:MAG: tetratricopeptide repeat protein [Deltaproteobacteria bacterium]|nr:tetratricopeptide repeat protein [Deltaproteobacteria bacterium]